MVKWDGIQDNIGEICALKRQNDREVAQETLEKIYRYVLPIMKKRRYRVHKLVEFLPKAGNLLGLNVNHGQRISIRLRYHHDPSSFIPFENVLGTMLHELCHNTYGPHDKNFFALLDELTSEMEDMMMKGFTGDPFMGNGRTIGISPSRAIPLRLPAQPQTQAVGDGLSKTSNVSQPVKANSKKNKFGKGQKLGGIAKLPKNVPIKQLALQAAERRREADRICKTTNSLDQLSADEKGEVIDLTHENDLEEGSKHGSPCNEERASYTVDKTRDTKDTNNSISEDSAVIYILD